MKKYRLFFLYLFKINVFARFWLSCGWVIARGRPAGTGLLLLQGVLLLLPALKFFYLAANPPRNFNNGHQEIEYKFV